MDKHDLYEALNREGFDPQCYDLEGGMLPERYTLSNELSVWSVYYSERGLQTGKRVFTTEREACEYFIETLREEPSARSKNAKDKP